VKLLFDENVSDRLVKILADVFPDSSHLRTLGMRGAEDWQVWERARKDGFIIVSKDTDSLTTPLLSGLVCSVSDLFKGM
jgi:predicted nuclease of predicted toxin-antitoxin system